MRLRAVRLIAAATALTAAALTAPGLTGAASAAGPATTATTFRQKVPLNVVLVGFPDKLARAADLRGGLPTSYVPIVRYPSFYGLQGRDVGLKYDFDYRIKAADKDFTSSFFTYVRSIGTKGDLTAFQKDYNEQLGNVRDVKGPVLYVDAPSTEKWLESNARTRLGIDGRRGYTVFLVNWYSRPDFRFHVYTRTDVADPDTGFNFGTQRDSRKLISWGGTSGRSYFYDFSAGPEAWTNNWNVDDADLDGDGAPDYRIPPVWEYTDKGYRSPAELPADMARIVRYVGINLLFTTSPLYDPLVTSPDPGGRKVLDLSMFEDDADPAVSGNDFLDKPYIRTTMTSFQPYYDWKFAYSTYDPIDAKAQRAMRIWAQLTNEDDCWVGYGTTEAEPFCYFDANRDAYGKPARPKDYRGSVYAFNTTEENLNVQSGLLGYADDNWVDGTQSYVFAFDTPQSRDAGFGFSTTVTHEFGHHIGMSHPHDGYDSETGVDYGTTGEFQYSWAGDETETVMSYTGLSNVFGTFDRDNMYRWEFAGYLNEAAGLNGAVLADPSASRVSGLISTSSAQRAKAIAAFEKWDYRAAATAARAAFEASQKAATTLGVSTASAPTAAARLARTAPDKGEDPRPYLTD